MFKPNFKSANLNETFKCNREKRIVWKKQIKTTIENEGQDLAAKVLNAVNNYMNKHNLDMRAGFDFTITDLISYLRNHVDDFRTSVPVVDSTDYLSNYELNVYNIKSALDAYFSGSRVIIQWSFGKGNAENELVTPREILVHENAKIKITIKAEKDLKWNRQYNSGENVTSKTNYKADEIEEI